METCSDLYFDSVIGRNMQRHRHQEFIRFLKHRRGAGAGANGDPRRRRQLRDPQTSQGTKMAGPASPLDVSLHLDVVGEAPPPARRGLVADAHDKRAIETRQCRVDYRSQVVENFLVIELRLRGEVLKGRRAPVIANQRAESPRRIDCGLRAGKRGNPRALGNEFG